MYGAGAQFGRGLENIVTSFAEIPCTIHADMKDRGGSGFFPGLGKGTLYMFRRLLVGVTEVGTFFIPAERTIPPVCQDSKPSVA
jgi:putative exosortase-associated protein (TIGR04073 family)